MPSRPSVREPALRAGCLDGTARRVGRVERKIAPYSLRTGANKKVKKCCCRKERGGQRSLPGRLTLPPRMNRIGGEQCTPDQLSLPGGAVIVRIGREMIPLATARRTQFGAQIEVVWFINKCGVVCL